MVRVSLRWRAIPGNTLQVPAGVRSSCKHRAPCNSLQAPAAAARIQTRQYVVLRACAQHSA
eukprot:132636-Alexandrium_andersonii.AAC.1